MKNYNAHSFAGIIGSFPNSPIPPEFPESSFPRWPWEWQSSQKVLIKFQEDKIMIDMGAITVAAAVGAAVELIHQLADDDQSLEIKRKFQEDI